MSSADLVNFVEAELVIPSYRFVNGQDESNLRVHFATMGQKQHAPDGSVSNAVLLLHNTTGSSAYWREEGVASQLFGPGQPLDLQNFFVITPDALGFGKSSKPSDGLRGTFPNFRYDDIVDLTHHLVTEHLGVTKLRLIVGVSMGGMLTWLMAGRYPELADAILPISCQPGPMSGRNWIQRRISIEAIRNDPNWNGGMYDKNPSHFAFAAPVGPMMLRSVMRLQEAAPDRKAADAFYWEFVERARKSDANDRLYQLEASMDYDPTPNLHRIEANVITVSFADDQLNPIELGVVDHVIDSLSAAKHIVVPAGPDTQGHLTAKRAGLWAHHISALLA